MESAAAAPWYWKCFDFYPLTNQCTIQGFRIGGDQDMTVPVVVVGLVIVLALFFLYSAVYLAYCNFAFQRRFSRLISGLSQEKAKAHTLDRAALNRLGEVLANDPLCEHGWQEFLETIVREEVNGEERIYNTRQANEFFSEEEIVEESMHPSFFGAVPGILTSLGLFGTFVAILLGLAEIRIEDGASTKSLNGTVPTIAVENVEGGAPVVDGKQVAGTPGETQPAAPTDEPPAKEAERIKGIAPFINALSGKFLSSVIALFTAILFTLAETRVIHRAHQIYRRFCQQFDSAFPRRTAEEILMAMNRQIEGQRSAFEHFNTTLAHKLRDGVTEGLGPVLERIVGGLESLTGDRDSNIEALLERLTTEFRNAMTQSAGFEFDQISFTMEQASSLIRQANEQTTQTQASFQGLVSAIEQSQSAQAQLAERQAALMNDSISKMVEAVGHASSTSREATDTVLRDMIERSHRESQDSARTLQETLNHYMQTMSQQVTTLCGKVETAATSMEAAGLSGSRGLAESIQRVTEQLAQATTNVVQQTGSNSERINGELSRLLEEHRSSAGAVADAREALEGTLRVWSESTQEMRAVVTPLREAAGNLSAVTAGLGEVTAEVKQAQMRVSEILAGAQSELRRVAEMETTSERLLTEHRRVFETVQSGLAGTLSTIAGRLSEIQDVTGRGLSGQLQEFDNHLSTATRKLGAAIDELGEVLDGAADVIAAALPRTS